MIEYKGYIAEVEFDDSVRRFHGRVINSGSYSIVSFEATDAEGEYERSFVGRLTSILLRARKTDQNP